ncbi:MAG: hypothetical protein UT34_C0002G0253 [candidate division WS6 bacterium GW2011_GWF2_39_15]|uniref:Lipopolysaccharide biosynthesis protein WbpB n=1 Tax=candidate division WS6 bacterium GW2011_GWF2_39_15 TaxID=1619100 RepID=A0A0G0MYW7_9BACT|nr:MAG: hypothetical protein UT34_C0002G0253 [candidate division WS6 bacterium GW2011_GWF2_39_15]
MSKRFAITGVGGYIAPRHLEAIKATGNELVAACDPNDSVGIMDRYFYEAAYFKEFERFDRHLDKLRRAGEGIDFMTVCSPNYLHDAHIRLALRLGADAICEKPLVLNPWNIDALEELAEEYKQKVYTILQLRVHPAIIALREKVRKEKRKKKYKIDLTYLTSRGGWYLVSWKGDIEKSGGLATNIGIHFFDMLSWIFGKVQKQEVHYSDEKSVGGYLELEKAEVSWFLSIDRKNLPKNATGSTYRSIMIDGEEFEFSEGFTDLHTRVYEETLNGNGFVAGDTREAIKLAHDIRTSPVIGVKDYSHPILKKLSK